MRVKIAKWGNSLGVRLPKAATDATGVVAGSELDLVVESGRILLRNPVKTSRELLEDMVAEAKRLGPSFEPEEVDWGSDRDSEIIDDDDLR